MELTSDSIFYGLTGVAIGFGLGYAVKKVMKFLIIGILALVGALVVGLMYLQNIKVLTINQANLETFVNNSIEKATSTIGIDCDTSNLMNSDCMNGMINPFQHIITAIGIPMTSGLGAGFLMGWVKG